MPVILCLKSDDNIGIYGNEEFKKTMHAIQTSLPLTLKQNQRLWKDVWKNAKGLLKVI